MRLFIGITFSQEIKTQIYNFVQKLRKSAVKGNFTAKENLHLTLAFIGEVEKDRIAIIEESIKKLHGAPFTLELDVIGKFNRKGGDIYWIGFEESSELQCLHEELSQELRENGFQLEERSYTPHLTLGRKVILHQEIELESLSKEIPKQKIEVSEIHLMLSHRVKDKLIYTPIKTRKLSRHSHL